MKKALSIISAMAILFGLIPIHSLNAYAASGVENNIAKLASVYTTGTYFTASGNPYYADDGDECLLANIPSRGGLPSGSEVCNACGYGNRWSCYSFVSYAFYIIYGTGLSNSYETTLNDIRVGDVMYFSRGHWAIYLGQDSTNWYVYDSNGDWVNLYDDVYSSSNQVIYNNLHAKSKWGNPSKILRANNYISVNETQANSIVFREWAASNVSANDATISTWVDNSGTINQMGFYLSSNGSQYNKIITNRSAVEWTSFHLTYPLSNYYGRLSPGQTYYYKFFVIKGDTEYTSEVATFNTSGQSYISFDTYDIPGVGEVSVRTRAWISNPNGKRISELGIICNKEMNQYNTTPVSINVSWTRAHLNYELCEYVGKLNPNTAYYVRYYAIVDGITYYSDYFMFTTYARIKFDTYDTVGSKVSDITTKAWIDNPNGIAMDSIGFAISTDKINYTDVEIYTDKTWTRTHQIYKINDYYKLVPNTKYYITYFVKADGVVFYSEEFSIKPENDITFDTYETDGSKISDITTKAWIDNPNGITMNSIGFAISTDKTNYTDVEIYTDKAWTRTHQIYKINDYYKLSTNTTYYVKYFVHSDDLKYYSDEFCLKPNDDISFDTYSTPVVSENNINIGVWFSNDNGLKIDSLGFWIGKDKNQMDVVETKKDICWTRSNLTYDILDYHNISPSTKYYYQFFVIIDRVMYLSDIQEFTSLQVVNNRVLPSEHDVGDTNLDGNIDIRDCTAIQRYLCELETFTEEQLAIADTNGDGEINIADATHLQMYLAEYDVVLGKQTT